MSVANPELNKSDWTPQEISKLGLELLEWLKNPDNFLLLEFFSDRRIPWEWVEEWGNVGWKSKYASATFKKAMQLARQTQEQRLAKMAISKGYATAGVIATLKNLCGWTSVAEVEQVNVELTPENLEKIKKKYFKKGTKSTTAIDDAEDVEYTEVKTPESDVYISTAKAEYKALKEAKQCA